MELVTLRGAISDARAAGVARDDVEVAEARLRQIMERREGAVQLVASLTSSQRSETDANALRQAIDAARDAGQCALLMRRDAPSLNAH
jgi:hypothetical protein